MPGLRPLARLPSAVRIALLVPGLLVAHAAWSVGAPASEQPLRPLPRPAIEALRPPSPPVPDPARSDELRVYPDRGRSGDGPVPGYVVARFAPGVSAQHAAAIAGSVGAAAVTPSAHAPFTRVENGSGTTQMELLRRLQEHPDVLWAELDRYCHALYHEVAPAQSPGSFNDPFYSFQWPFARIRLAETLPLNPTQADGVVVAVIDSGVAFGTGAFFPAQRGLDLEGTLFVPGLDFVNPNTPPYDQGTGSGEPGGLRFGHGTYVASLIAATANNGIAGVGLAPRARIMPLRVLGIQGQGTLSAVAEAISYAAQNGAQVINMSLGGSGGSQALLEAVRQAHRDGVVLVAAAGNEAQDPDFDGNVAFPARYPQVVAVGATTFADTRASYSSTGNQLEIMAPAGQSAQSQVGDGFRDAALATSFLHDPVAGTTDHASFWATGTSFSAPQVAAAAALLIALGVDDPEAVRTMLNSTALDLGPGGWDSSHGHGLIDLLEAHRGVGFSF